MSQTTLRGTRLGTVSYETDAHIAAAGRQFVRYDCPQGHETVLPFSIEAQEIPLTWTCRCGDEAAVVTKSENLAVPNDKPERHIRSHWDMLMERRTVAELESLLKERLALLRAHDRAERKSA